MIWLDFELQRQAVLSGRADRSAVCDATIQFCLIRKHIADLGLRQATGLAERLILFIRARLERALPSEKMTMFLLMWSPSIRRVPPPCPQPT